MKYGKVRQKFWAGVWRVTVDATMRTSYELVHIDMRTRVGLSTRCKAGGNLGFYPVRSVDASISNKNMF